MEITRIQESYKNYINSEYYNNLDTFRKLSDGKSAEVFASDVIKRIKMEYMGALDSSNKYYTYSFETKKDGAIIKSNADGNVKDLVCGYGILCAVTRLYAEYGTSKPLLINGELQKDLDLDVLLAKLLVIQSWAGRVLFKGVIDNKKYSFYTITPKDYFSIKNIFNPTIDDGFVIFSFVGKDKEKTMLCEIHELDNIEYRAFKVEEVLTEIQYPNDLTINGFVADGLGYKDPNAKDWAVEEIENIFGRSDYTDDLLNNVREIVVGDTLTSQAFQKVANPLIQVPDSLIEVDSDGKTIVRLDERIVTVREKDKDIKQIQLETKTNEWKEHRKELVDDIYKQTGVNDLAFGISIDGAVASGEAKRRSLERVLSTVMSKRDKCLTKIKKLLIWALERTGNSQEIEINAQDILSLSLSEKIMIVIGAIQNNLMSLETAIKFLGLEKDKTDDEIKNIKKNLDYKIKEIGALQKLESVSRDERLQKQVETMTDELIKDILGG